MKMRSIPMTAGWWPAVLVVLILLPWAAIGKDKPALNRQLMDAVSRGDFDQAQKLIDKGADANARDWLGRTPLIAAARSGDADVVRLLLRQGADVNAANGEGRTALHYAKEKGHEPIVHLLKAHGAKE